MRTPIRLVLDTTAVHTYPSIDIGEIIATMNDDGERFAVSVVALASTSALLGQESLAVLTTNKAFSGLDVPGADWSRLGAAMRVVNDIAAAHATLAARDNNCLIATTCPELYADLEDAPLLVIEN
jgi:hypothetical protein